MSIYWMHTAEIKGDRESITRAFPFYVNPSSNLTLSGGGNRYPGFAWTPFSKAHPDLFIIAKTTCDTDFCAMINVYHKGKSVRVYSQKDETEHICQIEKLFDEAGKVFDKYKRMPLNDLEDLFQRPAGTTVIEINEQTEINFVNIDEENI